MTWWQAIILGLVQGITEFLPVSSSGHLVLAEKMMGIDETGIVSFFSMLHVGTLIAVFIVLRKDILAIFKNIFGKLTWNLLIATIPAILFTLLFHDFIEESFGGGTLGAEFLFTGVLLLAVMVFRDGKKRMEDMNWLDALFAGLGQAIAILPAVSRSGASMSALLFRNVKREDAIRFAFLMSIPAILGSFALDLLDIIKGDTLLTTGMIPSILIGVIAAGVSGYAVMRFMLKSLTKKGLAICGIYVSILGVLVFIDQHFSHLIF